MNDLRLSEMLEILGEREIGPKASALLEISDFRYRPIGGERRDALVNAIKDRIAKDHQKIGAAGREQEWEDGWAAQLTECIERGFAEDSLIPKFIHAGRPMRILGEYAETINPNFEADWMRFLRCWFLETYFAGCDFIWEFGCGTGHNLLAAAQMYPGAHCVGLDFSRAAIHLVRQMADRHSVQIEAAQFDMRQPKECLGMPPDTGVLTFGAMEQLAGEVEPMLRFLLENKPQIVVNIEPCAGLYGESEFDRIGHQFQSKRGYTDNLIPALRQMVNMREIDILKVLRTRIGSLFIEGYNVIVWRPIA